MAIGAMKQDGKGYTVGEGSLVKMTKVGEGTAIESDCVILNSEIGSHCDIEKRNLIRKAAIGDMTYTGADTSIMWATVGKYCAISRMVDIGGNEHDYTAIAMMPSYRIKNRLGGALSKHPDEELVVVGNDVWIGQGVSIVRKQGLTVGDGAVIGSGAVVTKSIPPYAIVAGVPAKVIKYRFDEETIERLLKIRWWDWTAQQVLEYNEILTGSLTKDALTRLEQVT